MAQIGVDDKYSTPEAVSPIKIVLNEMDGALNSLEDIARELPKRCNIAMLPAIPKVTPENEKKAVMGDSDLVNVIKVNTVRIHQVREALADFLANIQL